MFIRSNRALRKEMFKINSKSILAVNNNKAVVTAKNTNIEKMLLLMFETPPRFFLSNFSRISYFESCL